MWKDWKKKVNDFFFEEIEEEVDEIEEETVTKKTETVGRQAQQMNNAVNAKITYQYPNDQSTPFRFPVIPDQQIRPVNVDKKRTIASKQGKRKMKSPLIHGYKQDKVNELDEVPAFMRRRQERKVREEKVEPRPTPKKEEKKQMFQHTRPDELDRVFRKRDGLLDDQNQREHVDSEKRESNPVFQFEGLIHTEETSNSIHNTPDPNVKKKETIGFIQTEEKNGDLFKQKEKGNLTQGNDDEPFDRPQQKDVYEPVDYVEQENVYKPFNRTTDVESERAVGRERRASYESSDETNYDRTNYRAPIDHVSNGGNLNQNQDNFSLNHQVNHAQPESEQESSNHPVQQQYETTKEVPSYLLNDPLIPTDDDSEWLKEQQLLLESTLKHFKVKANIVNVTQGPAVTRFEVQPALGVKVSRIKNLADDIKLNMSAKDIRIEAPIPGKNTIGIEVPNLYPQVVSLQEIIETEDFEQSSSPLTIALGLTIEGDPLITNVEKMPHGLIAGATGSGKSVCINTIILSILYKAHYDNVKLLMIDPKMVELTPYNGIPHLISPVITDVKAATMALKWAVDEMEARYEKFVEAGVRNIVRYNEKMVKQNKKTEKLPYIVVIIDELADLMMVSPQDVEDAICRIAQKARACGIHLIIATQRPSVDVITGLIKANIPTRIAFSVSSQVDSRTIIDTNGAEKLLGKGDMLFVENGANKSVRLQGPFVSDEEIDRVTSYFRSIAKPNYLFEQDQLLIELDSEEEDELINDVISFVLDQNQVSTSLLQRRFRIGYNRAARLIDTLEHKGIISAQNGSKPREVLATKTQIQDVD